MVGRGSGGRDFSRSSFVRPRRLAGPDLAIRRRRSCMKNPCARS